MRWVLTDFFGRLRAGLRRAFSCVRPAAPGWLPGARIADPETWTETDRLNFEAWLKTPTGAKFMLTLHAMTVGRALAVVERSAYENGVTGGMSLLVGEIERLAVEGEPEGNGYDDQDE